MNYIIALIVVFLLSATPFIEVVAVIPIGALAGLNTWVVVIVGLLGNIVTVWLVILLVEKIRDWLDKRREQKGKSVNRRGTRAEGLWIKFGLPGLALLGPIVVGSHLAAFFSMTFGGKKKAVFFWMTISLCAWALLAGILTYYGVGYYNEQTNREGFLIDLLEQN